MQAKAGIKKLMRSGLALSRGPIARSSFQSLAIRMTGLAISFGQAILAARILGAQGYGIAAVVLSAAQFVATLAVFGFGPLAVRELARYGAIGRSDSIAEFVRTSSRWVAVLAVLAGGTLSAAALSGVVPDDYRPAMLVSGLIVLPIAFLQLQRGIAQGLGRIATAQAPGELLRPALFVSFLILVVTIQLPLKPEGYVVAFAVASFGALALSLPFTLRGISQVREVAPDSKKNRRLRVEAMPFLAIALVGMLMGEINTLLLGWLATPHEAGLFQPVARLVPLMVLPVQAVEMRFAPRISELWERGQRDEIARLRRIFTYSTLVLTAFVALALAAAGPWLLAVFGPEFVQSAMLLWIVAGAQIISALCGPAGILLMMRGRAHAALAGRVVGLAVNCAIGLWLIRDHGATGAAIAMAGGIVAWKLATLALLRFRRQ